MHLTLKRTAFGFTFFVSFLGIFETSCYQVTG